MPLYDVSFAVKAKSAAAVRDKVRAAFPKSRRKFSGALALTIEQVREKSPAEAMAIVAKQVDELTITLEELVADLQSRTAVASSSNLQGSEQSKNLAMIQTLGENLQHLYACNFSSSESPGSRTPTRLRFGDDDVESPVQ